LNVPHHRLRGRFAVPANDRGYPGLCRNLHRFSVGVGDGYHGRRTAFGAIFNTFATSPYTVAHKSRALGSFVTITNLGNGRSISAKMTDRGPFIAG
jgi:hypothetical protein